MKYKLTLNEDQYKHIITCVETIHRICCGDVMELRAVLPITPDRALLEAIKAQSFPELARGESYGWSGGYNNPNVNPSVAKEYDTFLAQGYQIYREMLHVRNIAEGIDNVYTSPTLTTNKAKMPEIEVIKE